MLLENKIIMCWNPNNKNWYENKNYIFTNYNDEFEVKIVDLPPKSKCEVKVQCDYCGKVFYKKYLNYLNQHKVLNKDSCSKCGKVKRKEKYLEYVSTLDKLEIYKKIINNEIRCFPDNFHDNISDNDLKEIILYFIDLLIQDQIITNINDLPKIIRTTIFTKYKLASFLNKYNGIYNLLNKVFPNKWKQWELCRVKNNFWNDVNNINQIGIWFVDKLYQNHVINKIEDILNLDQNIFKEFWLNGLLASKFNSSPYLFWNYFYPNKWFEWEFKNTPKKYWSLKENRIKSLKQLCEIKLKLNINEIPNYISYTFLTITYHKFSLICDQYYSSNLFKWINECYPNIFKPEDFNQITASDGTKLDSDDERLIHEYLIKNYSTVKYYDNHQLNKYKWHNKKENENYIADWLVNNKLIIEYFGLYNLSSYNKNKLITDYINKSNRKILYFSNLKNYNFIDLYKTDLKNNLDGLKIKLSNIII